MAHKHVHMVGIGGSLRPQSSSEQALVVAAQAAEGAGASVDIITLGDLQLPLYDPEKSLEAYPKTVIDYLDRVRRADALIWSTPTYHGTMSGAFKNALDYLEFLADDSFTYLDRCVVGFIATAGGENGASNTLTAMTHVASALRAVIVPYQVPIHRVYSRLDEEGVLTDEQTIQRLQKLGHTTVMMAQLVNRIAVVNSDSKQ